MKAGDVVRVVAEGRPIKFTVEEVLFQGDDRDTAGGSGVAAADVLRWRELLIARTERGRLAIRSSSRTKHKGETDSDEWRVIVDDAADGIARLLVRELGNKAPVIDRARPPLDCGRVLARRALKAMDLWDSVAEEA